MGPKWLKKGSKMGPFLSHTCQKGGPFWDPFLTHLGLIWRDLGLKSGPKMGPKMDPKPVKKGSKRAIFDPFWTTFWTTF